MSKVMGREECLDMELDLLAATTKIALSYTRRIRLITYTDGRRKEIIRSTRPSSEYRGTIREVPGD
nr:hypothetical protein [Brevibacillus laterosporus]